MRRVGSLERSIRALSFSLNLRRHRSTCTSTTGVSNGSGETSNPDGQLPSRRSRPSDFSDFLVLEGPRETSSHTFLCACCKANVLRDRKRKKPARRRYPPLRLLSLRVEHGWFGPPDETQLPLKLTPEHNTHTPAARTTTCPPPPPDMLPLSECMFVSNRTTFESLTDS